MSQSNNSAWSLLAVVALLGLVFIATVLYSGDPNQQVKVKNNFFWRETRIVFNSALGFIGVVTDISLQGTNNSNLAVQNSQYSNHKVLSKTLDKNLSSEDNSEANNGSGFFSHLKSSLQKAWEESDGNETGDANDLVRSAQDSIGFKNTNSVHNTSNSQLEKFVEWRPIIGGAEVIFKLKNNREYKVVLPIKILGLKNNS